LELSCVVNDYVQFAVATKFRRRANQVLKALFSRGCSVKQRLISHEKCLTKYLDNPQKQKVIENKLFLEKDASR
jgi:hypothetical protein